MSDAQNSDGSAPRRVIGRPFAKGTSGNPSGRPKATSDMRAAFRQHTDDTLNALVLALRQPRYRVQAATTILAYGWGKPLSTADIDTVDASADSTTFVLKIVSTRKNDAGEPMEVNNSTGSVLTLERGEYSRSESE